MKIMLPVIYTHHTAILKRWEFRAFPFVVGLVVALLLAMPSKAFAFGPLTHLAAGLPILQDALQGVFPAWIGQALGSWPLAYLYGLLGPDITIARNLADFHSHCHNWRVGKEMLAKSSSSKERAFALGYLSHLAHDTYAHNLFLPKKILFGTPRYLSRHILAEFMLDSRFSNFSYLLESLHETLKDKDLDHLLTETVTPVVFSFRTNKFFFRRLLALRQAGKLDARLQRLSGRHPTFFTEEELKQVLEASYVLVRGMLSDPASSPLFLLDPTGVENLKLVRFFRRQIAHDSPIASPGLKLTLKQEVYELIKANNRPFITLLEERKERFGPLNGRFHPRSELPSLLLTCGPVPSARPFSEELLRH
jgi:hypothetical protein